MTEQKAIELLRLGPGLHEDVSEEYNEAADMGIEALDTISNIREAVDYYNNCIECQGFMEYSFYDLIKTINRLLEKHGCGF